MNTSRDLVGYANSPPHPQWPGNARIAVQFVVNYEEGAECSIELGDSKSESFISEMVGAEAHLNARSAAMESLYEYGSRTGFWRLHRLFTERGIAVTVFGVAVALAQNPAAVEAMQAAEWEIASHGLRWIDYQCVPEDLEREHLQKAIELHREITGEIPLGWYLGRTSPNTASLIAENGNFIYSSDSYSDDLPYYSIINEMKQLIIPYSLDMNDMKFVAYNGFTDGESFFRYLKDSFDFLYSEGAESPRMMTVGLHCRIAGRPGRTAAVARFIDHIRAHDSVWIPRRIDLARHWLSVCPT